MAHVLAQLIAGILYDDWYACGGNPPASEYLREGSILAEMLSKGASREEVIAFLRQAAADYNAYPVPEPRLSGVVDKIMKLR